MNQEKILWAVMGPTGTGKSDLAMELCQKYHGELISVDSAQVFKGLDVGTAKPTAEEQALVKHHLIDQIEPSEQWSAAQFAENADRVIAELFSQGIQPILCGGTGLWYRALIHGIFNAPEIAPELRAAVREELKERGAPTMHAELMKVDPEAAAKIQPGDPQRIGRALEVYRQTGTPISVYQAAHGFKEQRYRVVTVVLDWEREALRERLAVRAEKMYAAGMLEETKACLDRGIAPDAPGLSVIGYRDAVAHLQGKFSREEAVQATIVATRRYAKRQRNWFRHEEGILWISPQLSATEVYGELQARAAKV